jgi:hypothetical protein
MKRRTYLGAAGGGLVALSGCLGAVAGRVTNTAATPAFLLPGGGDCDDGDVCRRPHLVRALDTEVDSGNPALGTVRVRGWLTGSQLRATSHNASRSNRSRGAAAPGDGGDGDGADDGEKAQDYNSSRSNRPRTTRADADADADGVDDGGDADRAQNHNSSRSNRTRGAASPADDDSDGDGYGDPSASGATNHNTTRSNRTRPVGGEGDGSDESIDLDRAFAYLDGDGVVVGETFVVTAPVVDLPGLADPSESATPADYVKNMVSGARAASPTGDETVLRNLTTPTAVAGINKASPLLYRSAPGDGDDILVGDYLVSDLPGSTAATEQSQPVVGRCVATLADGVRLPVLVSVQRLVHEGDHVFVASWVVDEARLFGNAATVLTAGRRTPVSVVEPGSRAPAADAGRVTRTPDGAPGAAMSERMMDVARAGRRSDAGPHGDDDWMGLFVVPIDAPLGHLAHEDGIEYTDAWETAVGR